MNLLAKKTVSLGMNFIQLFFKLSGLFTILVTVLIVSMLLFESYSFLKFVGYNEFFAGLEWSPLIEPRKFGVLPIFWGSFMIAIGAGILAIPAGIGIGLYLSQYSSKKERKWLKPLIEVLAGVPSIVYGFFAMTVITPIIQFFLPSTNFFNALSACIVVSIMVLPTIVSLSDDSLSSLPSSLKNSAYALGATRLETSVFVLIPAASSGIIASIMLAFARAIGETMAVALAAGATPNLTFNPLESIQTMTAYVVQVSLGDAPHGTPEYYSIFAVALVLFLSVFSFNLAAHFIGLRLRRKYT